LTQERLGNGLWHFRVGLEEPDPGDPWVYSPMLADPAQWAGPHEGPESRLVFSGLDSPSPSLSIHETLADGSQSVAFNISPFAPDGQLAGLTFHGDRYSHVVGLGADFRFSVININRLGQMVMPGGPFGSIIETSIGTRASGIQSPVCYALGPGFQNAAIFINETRPLAWDFSSKPWYVGPTGQLGPHESIDFFVILGQDVPALRRILMSLLGRPAIPPKSVFAPWVISTEKEPSQSYQDVLSGLALNLGGFETMSLMFSPQPQQPPLAEAAALGLNLLITETPYLPADSPHFPDMAKRGFLVKDGGPQANPILVRYRGRLSGLIDYSHPPGTTYWHSLVRASQVAQGARLFNLVGGEPEIYSPTAWYSGDGDEGVHSQYAWGPRFALKWMESFYSVPQLRSFSQQVPPRLFTVSRAGMAGMGRFGAGVLTIEPNPVFVYNAAQARANLILSGVDYYSTDVSTIMETFPLNPDNRIYESWLANLVLVNLPLVIPAELLSYPWAKLNLDLKASLEPYIYSLAYSSSQTGDPLVAPLLYYFQDDPLARDSAVETMVGPSLLVASGVTPNLEVLKFSLPAGRWYDLLNRDLISRETGGTISLPAKSQGLHVAPMLVRSGAVIPMISDPSGPRRRQSILAFPGEAPSSFVWYEDNGVDLGYINGQFSTTTLDLEPATDDGPIRLTIRARQGSFPGQQASRQFWVEFVGLDNIGTALLDGEIYKRSNNEEQLHAIEAGWFTNGTGRLVFKTPPLDQAEDHQIVLD
jgi:alpha-glucosidase